jgi:subtilase family serine protease/uncharacterized membrane protein
MIKPRPFPLCVLASLAVFSLSALAQQAAPAARIVNPIDDSQLVTLQHTVHPLANAANDRGAAPDGMQLNRLQLVLQRGPSQETALRALLAQQSIPGSPGYHQFLTPAQFGAQFGASDQDISTIETWLGNHGFSVTAVHPGKGAIEFSGSVAQMRDAFHTQIHKYVVNGETHYANANNPQIPAALAPVIAGFVSLNNFHPKSYVQKLGEATLNTSTQQVTPQWTQGNSSGVFFVFAPGDFAKQYDLGPLYTAGVTGAGQTIAIVNDSNVNVALVNQFRTLFGLPANPPQVIIDGNDPGVDGIDNPDGPNYDSSEAYLDVEWAGAVAPNATVDLVVAADTAIETGLVLAMEHAVDGDVAPVVSVSFGECESTLGSTNAFINSLWEQAAAQGQTVMVSTGDSGSASCDHGAEYAVGGQTVSGFASTPYNVAVGGTDFFYSSYNGGQTALNTQLAAYWNTVPTQLPSTSLLQYIPEQPWNNSQYGLDAVNYYVQDTGSTATTTAAGGGGASTCATGTYDSTGATVTCGGGYPKPSWQTGTGVPTDGVRDLPDVSLFAANGGNFSFIPTCATDGDCQSPSGSNLVQITGVGGTSASSPAFAGIMALVNQKYGPQGQADTILYPLKAQYPAAFHDVANGTNSVPCATGSADCITVTSPITVDIETSNGTEEAITEGQIGTGTTAQYNAGAGYNLATGLGSIDANTLVTDWNKVTLKSTAVTMTPSSTSFAHSTAITISGTVTGTTPTGNVAILTDSTEPLQQGQGVFPLTAGAYSSATVNYLPGGTYHIWAQYSGDGANAMSTSTPPVQITVTPETPGMNFNLFDAPLGAYYTSSSAPGATVDYGTQLMLSSEVAPTSQIANLQSCVVSGANCASLSYTTPTGTVTFSDNSTTINTAVMNAEGDAEYNAPFSVGAHSVTAAYNGDQSYNKVTSSAIPFTVVKDTPTLLLGTTLETQTGQLIAGTAQQTLVFVQIENTAQYNVSSSAGAIAPVPIASPTGSVTFSGSSLSSLNGTFPLSAGVDPSTGAAVGIANVVVPANAATGTYTVEVAYSGDSNYNAIPGSSTTTFSIPIDNINTDGEQTSTITATETGSISPVSTITVTGTVAGTSGHAAPTGGVYLFTSGSYFGEVGFTSSSGTTSSFSITFNSQDLAQGANYITLQYSGDSVYNPSTFVLNNNSAIANPLSDFTLVPSTTIVPINISGGASNGTDSIYAASVNGFSGTVNVSCAATTPLTCGITPNPSLSNGSSTTSTLTINVPAGTANGKYNVIVTGKDAATGEFIHTLGVIAAVTGSGPAITLTNGGNITVAQGATTGNSSLITVTPAGGFTGTVNLSCSVTSAPAGAANPFTCGATNLSPGSVDITGTGALTSTLSIDTTATTTTGSYQVTVTGTSGSVTSSTVVNVTVTLPADFSLSAGGAITTTQGATSGNTTTITVTPSGGFSSAITLTCAVTTSPAGAANPLTCGNSNLNPTSVTPPGSTTSTLTASTTATTTTGAYVITVTGTSGTDVHTTTVNVTVNSAAAPSFSLSNSGAITISAPGATSGNTATITVTPSNGFTGTVNLTCALTTSPSGASDLPTCGIPGSVSVTSASAQTAAFSVTSTASTADLVVPKFGSGKGWLGAGSGALLALLVFFGIPARRRSWRSMLLVLIATAVIGALAACGGSGGGGGGGGGGGNPGTTTGAYTFTVTGTSGTGSTAITQTTIVSVTIE